MTLTWELADCRIAFSTIADGDARDPERRQSWLNRCGAPTAIVPGQVHGAVLGNADDPGADRALWDGVVSSDPRQALGVFGADCPGLILIAPDALGAAHCGWRGTAAGMVRNLVNALAQRSTTPPDTWHAFIGPGISGPRYQVDAPVLTAREWPTVALRPVDADHAELDLASAIAADCQSLGLRSITHSSICTASDPRLHSFRHDGKGIVQVLAVWRVETDRR